MKILSITDIQKLVEIVGIRHLFETLIAALKEDFGRWHEFHISPRHATYYSHGVIELMPCADNHYYAYKYVNGHPGNTAQGKLSVIAIGQLSDVSTGYPLMISEMTLLTAFRTAATGALAASYLARPDAHILAVIGTGAQSEFQVLGFDTLFPLEEVRFFDIDPFAMAKFSSKMEDQHFRLTSCLNSVETVHNADIIITATAAKKHQALIKLADIAPGTHIHAIGGDCPGKTELDRSLLESVKIVVEYREQSLEEGEVQMCSPNRVYAELWELICKNKPGREKNEEITLFDSVGFALEDFSALRVIFNLAKENQVGKETPLIPELEDPKDLFSLVSP